MFTGEEVWDAPENRIKRARKKTHNSLMPLKKNHCTVPTVLMLLYNNYFKDVLLFLRYLCILYALN